MENIGCSFSFERNVSGIYKVVKLSRAIFSVGGARECTYTFPGPPIIGELG